MTTGRVNQAPYEPVKSFDGSTIAARRLSDESGMPLLVVNAIGANLAPWRKSLIDIVRERPVYTWDHRGLLDSAPPATNRFDPGAQAEDAAAVLDHFDAAKCVLVSWSNGARIALELAYRYPERIEAMVLVCGTYGHAASRLVRNLELFPLIPIAAGIAKHFAGYLEGPLRRFVDRREIAGIIRQSGVVGANADTRALIELLRGVAGSDLKRLLATFEAVVGNTGQELLHGIEAPTLLIAGEYDQFSPMTMQEEMRAAISSCRLDVYERATHYLPLEYPAKLGDDIRKFFKDAGAA